MTLLRKLGEVGLLKQKGADLEGAGLGSFWVSWLRASILIITGTNQPKMNCTVSLSTLSTHGLMQFRHVTWNPPMLIR